jgi:hypothetical protein
MDAPGMSFVFPALLATTILAGIPILLHLILRQKPKSIPFPAFRFLVARHQTNQRKLQLRHWLLLAMRIMLIAGIILALARPRLLQHNLGLSSERPVAAVFVLDVSASMDARSSDRQSRLDDVKKRALELLDELPPGSRIAVLSSNDVRGDWLANPFQARQRIQNFKIQYASPPLPRSLIAAFRLLSDIATKREDEVATRLPRLLCVFSDTTRGAWAADLTPQVLEAGDQVPVPRDTLLEIRSEIGPVLAQLKDGDGPLKELLTELRDTLPQLSPSMFPLQDRPLLLIQQTRAATREMLKAFTASVGASKDEARDKLAASLRSLLVPLAGYQTMWFDVGLEPVHDLALIDLEWPLDASGAPQESVSPGGKLLLRPMLKAMGQDFQATLIVGTAKETHRREVKPGNPIIVPIEIDAAALKLQKGFHPIEFAVNVPDALRDNNQRFATIFVRPPRKVLVISPAPLTKDDDFFRALLSIKATKLDLQIDNPRPAEIDAAILAGYDAAFLFTVPVPTDKLWQALGDFARSGHGVAIVPGDDEMDVRAYQTAAAKAVLPGVYQKPIRLGKPTDKDAGTRLDWKAKGVFRHPVLQPFENWINNSNIDLFHNPPRVFVFWETTPVEPGMVLINYERPAGSPALLERKVGAGKVLQFTTPLARRDPPWNNYFGAFSSFLLVTSGLTVRHLTGELEAVHVNFTLGREEASVPIRHLGRGPFTLVGPQSGQITIDEKLPHVSIPQANMPGNYQIQAGKTTVAAFSMNLSPEEIDLSPWPAAEVENLFGGGIRVAPDRQANLRQLLKGRFSEPVELFPFFMVALLVLLAIENLLANRFYRRDERQTE